MTYRYLTVKVDGKTKLKHRHIMEQHLGRALLPAEQVHHRDENIRNNDISNLVVMTAKDHMAEHKQKHPLQLTCQHCGKTFTPAPTKRARAKSCSMPCANALRSKTEKATKSRAPMARALIQANFMHEGEIGWVAA
jgi:hypothetical protein